MTSQDHIRCAKRDKAFGVAVIGMGESTYRPWAVVAFFYSALHWMDAYIYKVNGINNLRTHPLRETWIGQEAYLKLVSKKYWQLSTDSTSARYEGRAFGEKSAKEALAYLTDIENHISPKL